MMILKLMPKLFLSLKLMPGLSIVIMTKTVTTTALKTEVTNY